MAFNGNTIIFDGISSLEYGLMLVDRIDTTAQEGGRLGTKISIKEDAVLRRPSPIYYTSSSNEPLEFKLVLSVTESDISLSRHDLAAIAGWLYGHNEYKELQVCQRDLSDYFYLCKIIELDTIDVSGSAVGVVATVRCDAPYAYMRVSDTVISCNGLTEIVYHNRSNANTYYLPKMIIKATGDTAQIKLENLTTGDSPFIIDEIPEEGATIHLDCMRQILTSDTMDDVYGHCNFKFPSFVRGGNKLKLTGKYELTIINEFPMYIGA